MMEITKLIIEIGGVRDEHDAARVMAVLQRVIKEDGAHDLPVIAHASNASSTPRIEPDGAMLTASVRELRLASRTVNALTQAGIHTIGQVLALNPNQIREVPGIGRTGRMSIDSALDELQLRRPDWHPR